MCGWEEIIYNCGCGYSRLQKMPYSCDRFRRHVYGPCKYDDRYDRDRVVRVYSDDRCPEPGCLFQYVNY